MKKYIIIKPGDFKAPPVKKYGQKRHTHYKVKLREAIIAEVVEEYGEEQDYMLRVNPNKSVPTWIRNDRNTSTRKIEFYVEQGQFLDDDRVKFVVEADEMVHEKRYDNYIFTDTDGEAQSVTLYGVDIMKTYETGEIWIDDSRGVKFSDIRKVEDDRVKLMLMAREVANKVGGKITREEEKEWVKDDSSYLTIHAKKVNLRSFINYDFFVQDVEKLKADILDLIRKHDPRSINNDIFRESAISEEESYDASDITVMFENLGLDKEDLFEKKRGTINGHKYGL